MGLALAAVAAVIVIAGGVVLASGGSDDSDTASPAADNADTADTEGESAEEPGDAADADAQGDEQDGGTSAGEDAGVAPAGDDAPVEAAEAFFDAVSSGDCEGIVAHMTPASYGPEGQTAEQAVDECEADASGTAAAAVGRWEDVRLVSVDGDEATIAVTLHMGAQESERELPMALVDGEWKMALDGTAAGPGQ